MPELPEVEAARALLQRVARGRRITAVRCARDAIVFEGVSPARFARALRGRRVTAGRRHGQPLRRRAPTPPAPPRAPTAESRGLSAPPGGGGAPPPPGATATPPPSGPRASPSCISP